MKIIIEAEPKEIISLIDALQNVPKASITIDGKELVRQFAKAKIEMGESIHPNALQFSI
jgi:hypothetical protein